jgi:beta-N-acetylhexosaminidase
VHAVEKGHVSRERIAEAHRRSEALLQRFAQPTAVGVAALGSAEHRRLAEGLGSDSVDARDPTARSPG